MLDNEFNVSMLLIHAREKARRSIKSSDLTVDAAALLNASDCIPSERDRGGRSDDMTLNSALPFVRRGEMLLSWGGKLDRRKRISSAAVQKTDAAEIAEADRAGSVSTQR